MNGALPPALLCAALGFAVASAPWRIMTAALVVLLVAAIAASLLPLAAEQQSVVLVGLWLSTAATAAAVHVRPRGRVLSLALALNAGAWTGAAIAVGGVPGDLARALPAALVALPAAWAIDHGGALGVKIVASWLIAVAVLAATLPIVQTPGYVEDHRG